MRKGLFWLGDRQWARLKPHLPTNQTGPKRDDDRRIISGIIHMLQCGARWRDCPPERPVIPNKSNRVTLHPFCKRVYKGRNVIERCFCRLKDFRRVATRYDKLARNFLATVVLAALIAYWI
jgi:transposase